MPAAVNFTVNAEAYVNSLGSLARPKLDQAVALALVDTAKTAIVQAGKSISARTGLKSATVKERIFYDRVAVGDYRVEVKSSRRPIPLIEFRTTQNASGVYTTAWGKGQTIQHAFIANGRGGGRQAFRRKGRSRLPIEKLWGPTIAGTFAVPEVQRVISDAMKARLQTALARRMAAQARRR